MTSSYSVDMSSLKAHALRSVVENAHVKTLQAEQVLAHAQLVLDLDLRTVSGDFGNHVKVILHQCSVQRLARYHQEI